MKLINLKWVEDGVLNSLRFNATATPTHTETIITRYRSKDPIDAVSSGMLPNSESSLFYALLKAEQTWDMDFIKYEPEILKQ